MATSSYQSAGRAGVEKGEVPHRVACIRSASNPFPRCGTTRSASKQPAGPRMGRADDCRVGVLDRWKLGAHDVAGNPGTKPGQGGAPRSERTTKAEVNRREERPRGQVGGQVGSATRGTRALARSGKVFAR